MGQPQVPSVFAIGNGFIGVRGPGDPPAAPRVYLNGVYERVPIPYHEGAHGYALDSDVRLAVADATRPLISLDGEEVGPSSQVEIDLESGLRTERWDLGGRTLRIDQFASMARTGLVAMRVTASAGATLVVKAQVAPPPGEQEGGDEDPVYDPRLPPRLNASPWREVATVEEQALCGRVDRLPISGFHVAAFAAMLATSAGADGETIVELVASYAARRDSDPSALVREAIEAARREGFEALLAEQRNWWRSHWSQTELALPRNPQAEGAVRHGLMQLAQAAARDGSGSVAAKGQTGEGYEGHIFWDADLYVLPVFAWTRPEFARAMLAWRIGGLEAARANARAMGQESGALYPWRTIGGRECSSFFPAGSAQYHINADIAFALKTYLEATGDTSILDQGGAEMLAETARIWMQIGFHDPDRGAFVINRVTGPDEYSAIVDNNLYTNLMASKHLRFAAECGRVDSAEAEAMRRAADAMFLPFDSARGVYAQDEAFFTKQPWPFASTPADRFPLLLHYHPLTIYRHQVAKQADAVLAVALMPDAFEPAMRRRMLDVYEAVTVHDSTLSASAFATAAARSGDAERAYSYWRAAVLTDLADLFGNSGHGLHMAALAGSWTSIVFGFAGLHVEESCASFDPIRVPALGTYSFSLRFRESHVRVTVSDREARYERLDGPALQIRHGAEQLTLADDPVVRAIEA